MTRSKNIVFLTKAALLGSLLYFICLLSSCDSDNAPKVVQLGNEELRESELEYLKETQQNQEKAEETIIDQWLRKATILNQFDSLPTDKQHEINFKLKEYKASLVRYELENQWIEKNLDTLITEEEMLAFYEENKKDFELSDFIVKVLYLKIPYNAPELEKVNRWYLLKQPKDTIQLTEYANKYAANFFYNTQKWIYFDDILKEIPLEGIDKEKFILNRTKTSFEENGFLYYLNILDYRLKNTPSPFSLERDNIRQRILTRRITQMRESLDKKFIDEAINKYEIHYFNR